MRADEFFIEVEDPIPDDADPWFFPTTSTYFNVSLIRALRKEPLSGVAEIAAAIGLLDLVHNELTAYGTDRTEQLDDTEVEEALRALAAVTRRLGKPLELPFRDFTRFRTHWLRQGASGSWQARRDLLEDLFEPTRAWLRQLEEAPPGTVLQEHVVANLRDPTAIREQLERIGRAVQHDDPALVIGSAKELVESTAKTVLRECNQPINEKDDLPALVSQAQRALGLHPSASQGPDGIDAVKRILGGMITVTNGLAELRNRYGTGHGTAGARIGLHRRHAQLAANAAITWCHLMLDTLGDPTAPWQQTSP